MTTSISDPSVLKAELTGRLRDEGFVAVGVTSPDSIPQVPERLAAFLDDGFHGDMDWLADRADWRADPSVLWPEVRSVVMAGFNYGPDHDPLDDLEDPGNGVISVYARNRDYHDILKKKLKRVARWLADTQSAQVKVFVDTAPVAEKPLAEAAGLGWQGKHTNLVSTGHGSWLFLGSIFTDVLLPPDNAVGDHCGSCRNCLDICPTDAFPAPYRLDARRCISYLTIEHKGHIPEEMRGAMGNRIYGCDDCLAVCPWNKFASEAQDAKLKAREDLNAPPLGELARLDDAAFRALFSGSPIKRTGRDRFVRNVLIAMGNAGDPAYAAAVEGLIEDESPLVRAMAVWAFKRVASPARVSSLAASFQAAEEDPQVRAEWDRPSPQDPAPRSGTD